MKETLLQFAGFNIWANKRIIDTMGALDEQSLDKEIASSYPSIRKTVYHTWSAEAIWLQRLQLVEQPIWMEAAFTGDFKDACALWQQTSKELAEFSEKQYDDRAFAHVVAYYTRNGDHHKTPVYTVLQHVFNHSTYHRGQMVTLLRQLGITKIPVTDLVAYTWK